MSDNNSTAFVISGAARTPVGVKCGTLSQDKALKIMLVSQHH